MVALVKEKIEDIKVYKRLGNMVRQIYAKNDNFVWNFKIFCLEFLKMEATDFEISCLLNRIFGEKEINE
jgi:hypothetical protein